MFLFPSRDYIYLWFEHVFYFIKNAQVKGKTENGEYVFSFKTETYKAEVKNELLCDTNKTRDK